MSLEYDYNSNGLLEGLADQARLQDEAFRQVFDQISNVLKSRGEELKAAGILNDLATLLRELQTKHIDGPTALIKARKILTELESKSLEN
jgi:hypothetical protein